MTSRRKDLAARVLESCRAQDLFQRGERVLVAVSGGADSMVLLDCLVRVKAALGVDLCVGHVDHGLRASSADDAVFVENACDRLGVPVCVETADVRGLARQRGAGLEEAGRIARYDLLAAMALDQGAHWIATGHTATDQAETVLMRLIRGTGPLGLSGIDPARPDGTVRPLLCATRDEVRAYATARGIAWRDDPTNLDHRHVRNRIRLEVLPLLRALNPRIDRVLTDLAEDAASLAHLVRALAAARVEDIGNGKYKVRHNRGSAGVDRILPYAILEAFEIVTGEPLGLARPHVQAVIRMARSGEFREAHLPRRVVASSSPEGVVLRRDDEGPPPGSARRVHRPWRRSGSD